MSLQNHLNELIGKHRALEKMNLLLFLLMIWNQSNGTPQPMEKKKESYHMTLFFVYARGLVPVV